jgi:hypothetical protein
MSKPSFEHVSKHLSKPRYAVPQPQRLRQITHSFAWVDHRLLRNGFVQVMTHQDQSLYLFLNLVADRNGVSFYRKEKICDLLDLDFGQFEIARDRLLHLGLLAFAPYSALAVNGFYQVLPVDGQPPDFAAARPIIPKSAPSPEMQTSPRRVSPAAAGLSRPAPHSAPTHSAPTHSAPMSAGERAAKRAARDLAATLAAEKLAAAFKAGLSKA